MKKTTNKTWLIVLIPFTFCLFCVGIYCLLGYSTFESHPMGHLEELVLQEDDFPSGWRKDYVEPIGIDDWGRENLMASFMFGPVRGKGFANQYIYHLNNAFHSIYAYHFLQQEELILKENQTDFLTYKSPIADDWYMACRGALPGNVICHAIGRYEDYIIRFSIGSKSEHISSEQLEKILRSMDDRMAEVLEK